MGIESDISTAHVYTIVIRLLISLIIGIIIGLEREIHHKAAGLRTCVLICLGATVFSLASMDISAISSIADPSRIAAGIVTGIGFLGAGTIIRARGSVTGLTTAATIWIIAALGLAVGLGSYALAFGGAILVVVVLNPFQYIERAVKGKKSTCAYVLKLSDTGPALMRIMKAIQQSPAEIKQLKVTKQGDIYELTFNHTDVDEKQVSLTSELAKTDGVIEVTTDQSG